VESFGSAVLTTDGSLTLFCPESGECYHSRAGAKAEAMGLYVEGSEIALRWRKEEPVSVLDVGLGLGYNALCTLETWRQDPEASANLSISSFENNESLFTALCSGLASWQENWPQSWVDAVRGLQFFPESNGWRVCLSHPTRPLFCEWVCLLGDIQETLPGRAPQGGWKFIWYDPFSPQKAPALWEANWFGELRESVHVQGRLMTYSVARGVRDALAAGGWTWKKFPTSMGKREWLWATPLSF